MPRRQSINVIINPVCRMLLRSDGRRRQAGNSSSKQLSKADGDILGQNLAPTLCACTAGSSLQGQSEQCCKAVRILNPIYNLSRPNLHSPVTTTTTQAQQPMGVQPLFQVSIQKATSFTGHAETTVVCSRARRATNSQCPLELHVEGSELHCLGFELPWQDNASKLWINNLCLLQ